MSRKIPAPHIAALFVALSMGGFAALGVLLPPLALAQEVAIPESAVDLRNQGLAQLENERPEKAEESYRALIRVLPEDPLGHANLAIALLRQQKFDAARAAIDTALQKAPGRGDLLAIRGDVLQWSGALEEALEAYTAAMAATPDDPEVVYALYRHAENLDSAAATAARDQARARLVQLRPENVVVMLAAGKGAIEKGDRTAATGAFLRIQELLWQAEPLAERALGLVLTALEGPEVAKARVPALRLENVLKVTPMYRESLRELSTGIQGIPVHAFGGETAQGSFGAPRAIRFTGERLAEGAGAGLAVGDLNGDDAPDVLWLLSGETPALAVQLSGVPKPQRLPLPPGEGQCTGLATFDLDNDGHLDALAYGPRRMVFWRGDGAGGLEDATAAMGLAGRGARAVVPIDFDIEGDLDLALFTGGAPRPAELLYNNLQGALQPVGKKTFPAFSIGDGNGDGRGEARLDVVASDLDRDGDLDLLFAHGGGLTWLDNLRQGEFADRTARAGLSRGEGQTPLHAVLSADLDNDGWPEIVTLGAGLTVWRNGQPRAGRFAPDPEIELPDGTFHAVIAFDADNDGRLDLALAGPQGVTVLQQQANAGPGLRFQALPIALSNTRGPTAATALAATDLDQDGDLDLVVLGSGEATGLYRLTNDGGNQNGWLALRLRGLDKGNSKNNLLGLGATVEVLAGNAYQFREVTDDVTHIGLGSLRRSYLTRVVWTNGVPQQRLLLQGNQRLVEEQLLKGSCPFLYAWDGERMAFVTDLLWGAPLGLLMAPGRWIAADPGELVRVDGAVPSPEGHYALRITEELWEAAFFDHVRLWVVDHPAAVEVASTLRILPGEILPEGVLGSRALRPVVQAWDGQGRDVTDRVARRDEVYADGYQPSRYQGVAAAPWSFTFDLGTAVDGAVRLHLDGWIFPADASLNLAVAQRDDLIPHPPRLEVEVDGAWRVLMPNMGFPAGKTKTMVVDTPPLPPGARRLRIVTGQWLGWDRIAWTTAAGIADDEPRVVARLDPQIAELRYRGFSSPVRRAPNGPHSFDYQAVTAESPWLPFPGPYTRFGAVEALLATVDDRNVILAPGDEIALTFDAGTLPPPPPGHRRTVFLESHGWDKDADRNTWEATGVEPLPLTALGGYPPDPEAGWEEPEWMEEYRREWLTRRYK
jgi:tetratricopeptide (TPR) repeat protein